MTLLIRYALSTHLIVFVCETNWLKRGRKISLWSVLNWNVESVPKFPRNFFVYLFSTSINLTDYEVFRFVNHNCNMGFLIRFFFNRKSFSSTLITKWQFNERIYVKSMKNFYYIHQTKELLIFIPDLVNQVYGIFAKNPKMGILHFCLPLMHIKKVWMTLKTVFYMRFCVSRCFIF